MHTVSFIVALVFFLIAAIISVFALAQISRNEARARNTHRPVTGVACGPGAAR